MTVGRVAETSHPSIVAEALGPDFFATVVGGEAVMAHSVVCPEYLTFLEAWRPREFLDRLHKSPHFTVRLGVPGGDAHTPSCPHMNTNYSLRCTLLRIASCDTYGEAVALMHQWVEEYRDTGGMGTT